MPELFPKISIVTPTYNQGAYIEECIQSVLSQEYPNLEYIIIDGGSTDNTAEIIAKYKSRLTYYISEKDDGLYDAINKGFRQSTGDIMGWLNSDDILHRKSLFSIAEIFSSFEEVNWIQGFPTVIDEKGRILFHREPRNDKYNFSKKNTTTAVLSSRSQLIGDVHSGKKLAVKCLLNTSMQAILNCGCVF